MARLLWLIFWLILTGPALADATVALPPLYYQVAGGEEEYLVPPRMTLSRVSLEKGVQWLTLARLNGLKKPFKLKSGMVLKINNTHLVPQELDNGLLINLPELMLYYFKDGVYQRRYALAIGRRSWPTPTGYYEIRNKRRKPTWTVPISIQEEMWEKGQEVVEQVPPGPENPLGDYWLGTSAAGVGIHATNRPWTVGHFVSHGCIRMLPEEIAHLYSQVEVGLPVKIIYRPMKLALTPEGRIYLEAHPNIYHWKLHAMALVKELARMYQLQDRIDWDKVARIVKVRNGIAQDVTKEPVPVEPATTTAGAPGQKEVKLSPLQGHGPTLE